MPSLLFLKVLVRERERESGQGNRFFWGGPTHQRTNASTRERGGSQRFVFSIREKTKVRGRGRGLLRREPIRPQRQGRDLHFVLDSESFKHPARKFGQFQRLLSVALQRRSPSSQSHDTSLNHSQTPSGILNRKLSLDVGVSPGESQRAHALAVDRDFAERNRAPKMQPDGLRAESLCDAGLLTDDFRLGTVEQVTLACWARV